MTDLDLEDVAAWALRQKWLGMNPESEDYKQRKFIHPLIRMYQHERPRELREEARKAAQKAEKEEQDRQRAISSRARYEHAERMKDMRKWGPENGYFVGTRGRIAKRVVEAYNKAKGITE